MSQPFFVRSLTRNERTHVRSLGRRPPNLGVYRRVQAVHLSCRQMKVHQIAEIVGRSRITVTRWLHAFDARGLPALWPDKSPGRPAKADAEFQAALVDAVEHNPRDLGYAFTRWTVELLAEHLRRTIHTTVSSSTVRNALKRLGYRYGRPKLDLKPRQDPAEVTRAKRQKARAIKKPEPVTVIWRFSTVTKRSSTLTPVSVVAGLGVAGG